MTQATVRHATVPSFIGLSAVRPDVCDQRMHSSGHALHACSLQVIRSIRWTLAWPAAAATDAATSAMRQWLTLACYLLLRRI